MQLVLVQKIVGSSPTNPTNKGYCEMKYILLFWIFGYTQGGTGTAEFLTKERCEYAGQQIIENIPNGVFSNYLCVEK